MRQLVDSISALIGDTPCIPFPSSFQKTEHLYLKLEGFNPTGSMYDRLLLYATIQGQDIAVTGPGTLCASAALLGAVLQVPVLFEPDDHSLFVNIAEALGGHYTSGLSSTMRFDEVAALEGLIAEVVSEVPEVTTVFVPALPGLPTHLQEVSDVTLRWIEASEHVPATRSLLADHGILVDPHSAMCIQAARSMKHHGPVVIICAIDGAIALAEMEM